MSTPIYPDYNATTPVAPEAAEAMRPFLYEAYGNPSSTHAHGRIARQAVAKARSQVAALIGAAPEEIVFTGCATEANNLALLGVAQALAGAKRHLVVSAVEHPAVPARHLAAQGWQLTLVPVDRYGSVSPDEVARALRPDAENVPAIVGFGVAVRLARERLPEASERLRALRDRLHGLLGAAIPGLALNGHPEQRLPDTLHVSFPGTSGRALLEQAGHVVAASLGSACHSEDDAVSGVLAAMGADSARAAGAVRLSVGAMTTADEVNRAAHGLIEAWQALTGPKTAPAGRSRPDRCAAATDCALLPDALSE